MGNTSCCAVAVLRPLLRSAPVRCCRACVRGRWRAGAGHRRFRPAALPALDGDPHNPPRFDRSRPPRSGAPAQFNTVPNFHYRPAIGAGTTGFNSAGTRPASASREAAGHRHRRRGSAASTPAAAGRRPSAPGRWRRRYGWCRSSSPRRTHVAETVTNRPVRRPVVPLPRSQSPIALAPAPPVPLRRILPYESTRSRRSARPTALPVPPGGRGHARLRHQPGAHHAGARVLVRLVAPQLLVIRSGRATS